MIRLSTAAHFALPIALCLMASAAVALPVPAPPRPGATTGGEPLRPADDASGASTVAAVRLPLVHGQPRLMIYARGLSDTFDLPLYRDLGFTTLLVDVPWSRSQDFTPADIMIRSAARLGLGAVVQLHPGEPPASLGLRVDSSDDTYRTAVDTYLHGAAAHFRAMTEVDAVMFEDDSEQHIRIDDDGFRRYLGRQFSSVAAMNRAWGTQFSSASQVTMDSASRARFETHGGLSLPALSVGEYRAGAYQSLLDLWTQAVKDRDPIHPVFCGRQDLPRAMVQTPPACAGTVVAATPPETLPVDIGRRGGRFVTIAALPAAVALDPDAAGPYLLNCLLHGAGGVAFPSWPAVVANRGAHVRLKLLLRQLQSAAAVLGNPAPPCAVVYEPLAPGSPEGGPAAPFGYMAQPADREPGNLLRALSKGSRYGFPDILSADDAADGALARYRVIFLPSVFVTTPRLMDALLRYTRSGGLVVADLGFDLEELGNLDNPWPEADHALFGIQRTDPLEFARGLGNGRRKEPLAPDTWSFFSPRADLFPGITESNMHANAGTPLLLSGPKGFIVNSAATSVLALNATARSGQLLSGVFTHPVGAGTAVFATFRLWSQWSPDSPLFDLFHWGPLQQSGAPTLETGPGSPDTVAFTPEAGSNFALLQLGAAPLAAAVRLTGDGLNLRTHCIVRSLPTDPPTAMAAVSLLPYQPVVCEETPVRMEPRAGFENVALDEYSARAIRLKVCGTGSSIRESNGRLHLVPGGSVETTLTIPDGLYPVSSGSRHVAIIRELEPGGKTRRVVLTAGAGTTLTLSGQFTAASVEIRPLGRHDNP